MRMPRNLTLRWPSAALVFAAMLALLSACGPGRLDAPGLAAGAAGQPHVLANWLADADPQRGRQALQDYGCVSCHTIPGVPGANSLVGPPLTDWAGRGYIAGLLPNTPDNLVLWIQFPQEVQPGNVMPNMNVGEADARDMAAYLYTLEPRRPWWGGWLGSGSGAPAPASPDTDQEAAANGEG
jgi:cytochrome c